MADFKGKLQKIKQLRQERDECEEQLYFSKLELFKSGNLARKLNIKEIQLGDDKNIQELRSQISALSGQLHGLNLKLNEADYTLLKKKENDNCIKIFKNKTAAVKVQLREVQSRLDKENKIKKPDRRLLEELKESIKKLQALSGELKPGLEKSEKNNLGLLRQLEEASAIKKDISAKKLRLQDDISKLEKKLLALSNARERNSNGLAGKRNELKNKYRRYKDDSANYYANLKKEIENIYTKPHPREVVKELDDSIPFLLLPVRIETRFMVEGDSKELWLRIYPDDIAVHTHEKLLTDKEVAEGIKYWKELFAAKKEGGDQVEDSKKSAWKNIAALFGPQRSAWIAMQTKPANWSSDLNDCDSEDQLKFPSHELTKTHAWSRAPRTKILPDKFVVMRYENDAKVEPDIVGPVIPDELFVGPDPLETETSFENKDEKLLFGESFNWMSDFDKAIQIGMGFRIPLSDSQASNGFTKILVLGLCMSADAMESKQKIEELIDNHNYSPKGFSIAVQGTATNNTEQDGSGYSKNTQFNDSSYFVEAGEPLFDENTDCDGRNLANALGIEVEYDRNPENPSERKYGPLQFILNADATDYKQAVSMNKALYPATFGYFIETLLQPVFSEETSDNIRQIFVNHVTGRGPLPCIRVGNQPYGILLTSDFGKWEWSKKESSFSISFLNTLVAVLRHYQEVWDSIIKDLMYVGKAGKDPSEVLLNILGLQAGSVSFYQRTGYSTDYLINLDNFQYRGKYADDITRNFQQKGDLLDFLSQYGYNLRDELGILKVPQALRLVYQHFNTSLDAANLVDSVPLSEKDSIQYYDEPHRKNYLHWLSEASSIETLERQNFGIGKAAPNTLLYLKLRRAMLLQLHKASVRWFKKYDIELDQTLRAANFLNIRPQGDLTKNEVMRAKVGTAVHSHPYQGIAVSDYLLTSGSSEDEAIYVNDMKAALGLLAETSTAKLERCFTEHLDVCTYRLDAWQTALFRLRLLKNRNVSDSNGNRERKKGIYIGAYGWLENIHPISRIEVAIDTVPEKLRPVNIPNRIEAFSYENHILKNISEPENREKIKSYYLKDNTAEGYSLKGNLTTEERTNLLNIIKSVKYYHPLYEYADNGGFVHAPSLNHASTAAVLRSGYLSHADSGNPDMMAINLSSERVRRALFILSGMQNNQPLEVLLGYQFERGLHDMASADDTLINLNLYIYNFREKFPFQQHQVKQQGAPDSTTESISASNVVNGIALAESSSPLGAIQDPTDEERVAIMREIDKLADTLDAVKDLLLAESTYQMVQGNFDRAGAILNAVKDVNIPPNLDVINTPRGNHLTFTNRVTVQFGNIDPGLDENNPWYPMQMTPRAIMEAGLNKWLGKVLGKPSEIFYRVYHLNGDGNEIDSLEMNVEDLRTEAAVQPIDLVYIAGNELNTGAPVENKESLTGMSELECRIAYHYRCAKMLDDEKVVRIEFMKPDGKKTLGQLLPLLRALKSMITDSRHLHAEDFDPPSKESVTGKNNPNPKGYDIADLQGRLQNVAALLERCLDDIDTIRIDAKVMDNDNTTIQCTNLKDTFAAMDKRKVDFDKIIFTFNGADVAPLQNMLIHVASFGVPDAFPRLTNVFSNEHKMILLEQTRNAARKSREAYTKAIGLLTEAGEATGTGKKVDLYIAAGKSLLSDVFNILPLFNYNNEADILQSNNDRSQLLKHATEKLKMTFVADEWLQNAAYVCPKLARWDFIRTLMESLNEASLELSPVQLPYRANDSWLAVEFPEKYQILDEDHQSIEEPFNITHDTLSVVVHGDAAFSPAAKSGLLIDDWTEIIPTREEITGITFNYNRPNACPPQTLLLAVPPLEKGYWTWDELVGILNDTLQRAKRRAVEPILLDKLDRAELSVLLPAIVADFSQYDLNASLDYRQNLQYFKEKMPVLSVPGDN